MRRPSVYTWFMVWQCCFMSFSLWTRALICAFHYWIFMSRYILWKQNCKHVWGKIRWKVTLAWFIKDKKRHFFCGEVYLIIGLHLKFLHALNYSLSEIFENFREINKCGRLVAFFFFFFVQSLTHISRTVELCAYSLCSFCRPIKTNFKYFLSILTSLSQTAQRWQGTGSPQLDLKQRCYNLLSSS